MLPHHQLDQPRCWVSLRNPSLRSPRIERSLRGEREALTAFGAAAPPRALSAATKVDFFLPSSEFTSLMNQNGYRHSTFYKQRLNSRKSFVRYLNIEQGQVRCNLGRERVPTNLILLKVFLYELPWLIWTFFYVKTLWTSDSGWPE